MKYSPKEERPGRAQRRQTNGRGRCSWGRAGAGGVRKFPDGGELRAEQVIEHLAHGRGHVLHKGFQGSDAEPPRIKERAPFTEDSQEPMTLPDASHQRYFFQKFGLTERLLERCLGEALSAGGDYADL